MTFRAFIHDGRLAWHSEPAELRFKVWAKDNEGKEVTIRYEKPKRSLSQNALYWVYLNHIEEQTGNVASTLHEYFRRTLLPPQFVTVMGKELKLPQSTTSLNKSDFSEYLLKIEAETGIVIPDPTLAGYIPN